MRNGGHVKTIVAMSSDYAYGSRLDQLIGGTLERITRLFDAEHDPRSALAAFSGDQAVRIMSIHKSKGLEFEVVIVLGVEAETFWGKVADERSAFFVAISRAKKRLYLTYCDERARPSGFPRRWNAERSPHAEFLGYAMCTP